MMPLHDGDGCFSAVGAGLGYPSPPGSEFGPSSFNGGGKIPPGVDRIDASWEVFVILSSNGGGPSACEKIIGNSRLDGDGYSDV